MPLVRISLRRGKRPAWRRQVSDAVHAALVETIGIPDADRFHLVAEHAPEDFIYDPSYLGIERSADLVIIQITLSAGRALAMKRALYRAITERLGAIGVRAEDVWINLVEVAKENWCFGLGEASYAAPEEAALAR